MSRRLILPTIKNLEALLFFAMVSKPPLILHLIKEPRFLGQVLMKPFGTAVSLAELENASAMSFAGLNGSYF